MKCHNCDYTRCNTCGCEHLECPKCSKKDEPNVAAADAFMAIFGFVRVEQPESGSAEEGGL